MTRVFCPVGIIFRLNWVGSWLWKLKGRTKFDLLHEGKTEVNRGAEKVQKLTHCKNTLLTSGCSRGGGEGHDSHQGNGEHLHDGEGGGGDGQDELNWTENSSGWLILGSQGCTINCGCHRFSGKQMSVSSLLPLFFKDLISLTDVILMCRAVPSAAGSRIGRSLSS